MPQHIDPNLTPSIVTKETRPSVSILPSYSKRPTVLYFYICQEEDCGWWDVSNGIAETFGDMQHAPGLRMEPCQRCQHAPMYLVARDDLLRVKQAPKTSVPPSEGRDEFYREVQI